MKPGFYIVTSSSVYLFTNRSHKDFRGEFRADTISLKVSIQTCLPYKGGRESEEVSEMPNVLRWFVDLAKEMDRGMSTMRGGDPEKMLRKNARPEVGVSESGSGAVVRINLNGVAPEDVDLTLSNRGVLIVSGVLRTSSPDEKTYNLEDLENFETFREVVKLPAGSESGDARAAFKDGALEISFQKSASEEELTHLRIENS